MTTTSPTPKSNGDNHGATTTSLRTVSASVISYGDRGYRYSVTTSRLQTGAYTGKPYQRPVETGIRPTRAEAWDKVTTIIRNLALEDGI